jgi:hypothetical protein
MKCVDLYETGKELSQEDRKLLWDSLRESSSKLAPGDHNKECPVASGSSMDCVWPFSVCVEGSWEPPVPMKVFYAPAPE